MKLLFSEASVGYSHYQFPYAIWAVPDEGESAAHMVERGLMPSSGTPLRYHLSRSVRIRLAKFAPFSENRGKLGSGCFFFINTWLMVEMTGNPASAALSLMLTVLPSLILSPAIGVLVERHDPARVAYTADFVRAAALLVYAALYAMEHTSAALGYAIGFLVALAGETQFLACRATPGKPAAAWHRPTTCIDPFS